MKVKRVLEVAGICMSRKISELTSVDKCIELLSEQNEALRGS